MTTAKAKTSDSWQANHFNNTLRLIGLLVGFAVVVVLYHYFIHHILKTRQHYFTYFVVGWLLIAYVILPHAYRWLSKVFLPNYFIGRTQTGDGMLGDPINLAINGRKDDLVNAMLAAGWKQAEKLDLKSSLKMIYAAVTGTLYPSAPVSSLFLFNKKQDLVFEKDVGGNPRKRHHARFWKTPQGWWLPGGYKADWLGAATFDKNVGLSLFTGQVTHKIDSNVDHERDFVVSDLQKSADEVEYVKHFTSSYHSRNGGGDIIHTDGSLPFVSFKK
jgi:hypothetical protein